MTARPSSPAGRPVGESLASWSPPPDLPRTTMQGRYCRLETLDAEQHAEDLFESFKAGIENWLYLPYGPFESLDEFRPWLANACRGDDPLFYAIISEPDGKPVGVASYLRIAPESGSIEVGNIHYSERLKKTPAATEAMFLMMERAFDLGYRRYEWKCDSLNAGSRSAALRLGLSFEGIFRQATVYKGRNRDTAWYAAIDREWPALRDAFHRWLAPSNFDRNGNQRCRLRDLDSGQQSRAES